MMMMMMVVVVVVCHHLLYQSFQENWGFCVVLILRIIFFAECTQKSPEEHEESININEAFETSIAVGAHSFSKMDDDIDKKRKIQLQYETHIALLNKEHYKRLVS